jgi:cytoskeleton protein RodZ
MNDGATPPPAAPTSAGAMLRAAREQRGVHIGVLAASIKVAQRKLEALEADRYDELPDMTFTRALALSVCRTLKIDADPVLALLPQPPQTNRLERVASGLNAPFRDRPGRDEPSEWLLLKRPAFWGTALVLLAAAVLALLPEGVWQRFQATPEPPAAASAPDAAASVVGDAAPAGPAASEPAGVAPAVAPSAEPAAPPAVAPAVRGSN